MCFPVMGHVDAGGAIMILCLCVYGTLKLLLSQRLMQCSASICSCRPYYFLMCTIVTLYLASEF